MPSITIGKLAATTKTKPQTIRYYEEIGLLPLGNRTEGGHRLYGEQEVRRLTFIRHARDLGFTLENIRELLKLVDHPELSCKTADQLATTHLSTIEYKLKKLIALHAELTRMIKQCRHGQIADCRVIEVLNDHGLCITEH